MRGANLETSAVSEEFCSSRLLGEHLAQLAQKGKGPCLSQVVPVPKNVPEPSHCANLLSRHVGLCHILTNYQEPSSHIVHSPSNTFGGH